MTRISEARAYAERLLGFKIKIHMPVKMTTPCSGSDFEDEEHTTPIGALGTIEDVEFLPEPKGLAITVVIPVNPDDESDERAIVSVFDESDPYPRFPFQPAS